MIATTRQVRQAAPTSQWPNPTTIQLPLAPPAASSYLFLAYPLAIVAAQSSAVPWLMERSVELYFIPGRGLKIHTHRGCTSVRMPEVYDADFPGL